MRVYLLGTPIDLLSCDESVARAVAAMTGRAPMVHVALNVAKFVQMRRNAELRRDVEAADMVGADGMGIVLALRLFGVRHVERVTGIDLMETLFDECARRGLKPYVLGARADMLERAGAAARERWPGLVFAGMRDGYFAAADEEDVVAAIRASGADCLFVAMPTPKKERFLARHGAVLDLPFVMGVGGAIDILAGSVRRAPRWMQGIGLEWLYRLLQEPRRMLWRYAFTNIYFAGLMLGALLMRLVGRQVLRVEPGGLSPRSM